MYRLARAILCAGFALSVMMIGPGATLAVAPSNAPTIVSPANGSNVGSTNPVLNWTSVAGATKYRVQVSAASDFSSLLYNSDTYSLHAAPTVQLPTGTVYWRVAGLDGSLNAGPSAQASFIKTQMAAPSLTSPIDGQTLHFPVDPLLFVWQPVAGATSYTLQVSNDSVFTDPTVYKTVNTSFGLTDTQAFEIAGVTQSYYWRVQATRGTQATAWSPGRSYRIDWAATPTLESPEDLGPDITDTVFSWDPVPGAASYQLQVSPDNSFSAKTIDVTVKSTRYSPYPALLNGSYYWRVRAVASGTASNVGQWSAVWSFDRAWATQPVIVSPYWDGGSIPDLINEELDWTPASAASKDGWVDHADHYEIQISTSVTFSGSPIECYSNHTTLSIYTAMLTGGNPCSTGLSVDTVYYWRVRGIDSTKGVLGQWDAAGFAGNPQRFTYRGYEAPTSPPPDLATWAIPYDDYLTPECVDQTDPSTEGRCTPSLGDTQRLSWARDPYAGAYVVWVAKDPAFTNMYRKYKTVNTSLMPHESWLDSQAGESYYWFVQPCEDAGLSSCGPDPTTMYRAAASAYRKFSQPADAVQALSTTSAANPPVVATTIPDQITFNWGDFMATSQALPYPEPSPLPNGSVSSRVTQEAKEYEITVATAPDFNASSILDNKVKVDGTQYTPSSKTYVEGPLYWKVQAVDGSGNELTASSTGTVTKASSPISLISPSSGATVTGVPSFTWSPQNWAYQYTIEIYKNGDTNFSSANRVTYQTTYIAGWTPTVALPAGVYAWRVQRLDRDKNPGPWSAGRLFTLNPNAPTLTSPADQASVGGADNLFSWTGPTNVASYRFQTSGAADFGSTIESQNTVMPQWSPTRLYANGTYYWRVLALDASNNVLSTSGYRKFTVGTVVPPTSGSTYSPLTPARILDTRTNTGIAGILHSHVAAGFVVRGHGGVPSNATAVTGNLTVTQASSMGFLYIGPNSMNDPTSSTLNFPAGDDRANGVTVALSPDGKLYVTYAAPVKNTPTAHAIFDVTGYFTP
jgi:hypothetical protein